MSEDFGKATIAEEGEIDEGEVEEGEIEGATVVSMEEPGVEGTTGTERRRRTRTWCSSGGTPAGRRGCTACTR